MDAKREGDEIVIRIPIANLENAIDAAWQVGAIDARYRITNIDEFTKDFILAINREVSERGDTLLDLLLDDALRYHIEQGYLGLEEQDGE